LDEARKAEIRMYRDKSGREAARLAVLALDELAVALCGRLEGVTDGE
jgi:hypothetical protein